MDKKHQLGTLIAVVVALLAALALGMGIRKLRSQWAESKRKEPEPAAVRATEDAKPTNMTEQNDEFLSSLDEEIASAEEAEDAIEEDTSQEEPDAAVVEEEGAPAEQQWQMAQSAGDWRTVWADLNLTEEEQARLREGLRLAWERWQNMSEQERQAETERLRAMGETWENMSEEEKRDASQRMRDRFEEWRKSDRVELPELSLD